MARSLIPILVVNEQRTKKIMDTNKEVRKMRKMKKAVGYVCDVPIPGTEEVIGKEEQRLRIIKHAEKEGLELACIYEDEGFSEDFASRPGVKKMLSGEENFDLVLVERVWSLTRKRKPLDAFLKELDRRDAQLASTSYLWDFLSQHVRHRYAGAFGAKARTETKARAEAKRLRVVA